MKSIPGYEGLYAASSCGRIWSIPRVHQRGRTYGGHFLHESKDNAGYLYVLLCKDGDVVTRKVHRLIALAWHGAPSKGQEVNHKNGIKTDNAPENLEWCSRSKNKKHAWANGLCVVTDKMRSVFSQACFKGGLATRALSMEQAREIRRLAGLGMIQAQMARQFTVSKNTIRAIVNNERYLEK